MINIPEIITPPLSKKTVTSLNKKISSPLARDTVKNLNVQHSVSNNYAGQNNTGAVDRTQTSRPATSQNSAHNAANSSQPVNQKLPDISVPVFSSPLRKGQKIPLNPASQPVRRIKACFGWNINDARCDMDASAFLVTETGKVAGDDWFVFYGQPESPENSVRFYQDTSGKNREIFDVDLIQIDSKIKKIVFVLTINEAFKQNLNFSMIKDAYIRLIDADTEKEIAGYMLEEYYPNVTSMTIGELYLHNGQWKFNPVGNGVHQDLAGQCEIYGVAIS